MDSGSIFHPTVLASFRSGKCRLEAGWLYRLRVTAEGMLEELAWTQQLPALAHLLGRDDIPRKEHHLPRPLTPDQDQLIQRELLRRNDFTSNVLLLLRHTGMQQNSGGH